MSTLTVILPVLPLLVVGFLRLHTKSHAARPAIPLDYQGGYWIRNSPTEIGIPILGGMFSSYMIVFVVKSTHEDGTDLLAPVGIGILGFFAGLLPAYAWMLFRAIQRIRVTDRGIELQGLTRRQIAWSDVTSITATNWGHALDIRNAKGDCIRIRSRMRGSQEILKDIRQRVPDSICDVGANLIIRNDNPYAEKRWE